MQTRPGRPSHLSMERSGVFDEWSDESTLRRFIPPRTVDIDWSLVDPTAGRPFGFAREGVPLRVRAAGVRIERRMRGRQRAWVRLSDGQWRALVDVTFASANGQSALALTMMVVPDALHLCT
ncbi:hypothetical protein [Gordonia sputi]